MYAIFACAGLMAALSVVSLATPVLAAPSVFAVGHAGEPVPDSVYADPNVKGVTLVATWAAIETQDGQFDWSMFDAGIASAKAAHKMIILDMVPGISAPAWLYGSGAGAKAITLNWWLPSWGPKLCTAVQAPLPWDSVYLDKWTIAIAALAQRYGGNATVVGVKISGVNFQTSENVLPWKAQAACPDGVNALTAWQTAGYRPALITDAWERILVTYAAGFPHTRLVLQTGGWGQPPINASGVLSSSRTYGDVPLTQALGNQALKLLGTRFIVANNGLSATWNWPGFPALVAAGVPVGAQEAAPVIPNCARDAGTANCTAVTTFAAMQARTVGLIYVELYQPDVTLLQE